MRVIKKQELTKSDEVWRRDFIKSTSQLEIVVKKPRKKTVIHVKAPNRMKTQSLIANNRSLWQD